jgi:hypothetical protein
MAFKRETFVYSTLTLLKTDDSCVQPFFSSTQVLLPTAVSRVSLAVLSLTCSKSAVQAIYLPYY